MTKVALRDTNIVSAPDDFPLGICVKFQLEVFCEIGPLPFNVGAAELENVAEFGRKRFCFLLG